MYLSIEPGFFASYVRRRANVIEQARALSGDGLRSSPELIVDPDGTAHIPIRGVLADEIDPIDVLLGEAPAATYTEIVDLIDEAERRPDVTRVIFDVDSPGGYVDVVDIVAQTIAAMRKPSEAHVWSMAASAAYWLASQADRIVALSPASLVGSIGVLQTLYDMREMYDRIGIKEIVLSSSQAPNKAPDPTTDEGQEVIRHTLDELHHVFASRVAVRRGVSVETVNNQFGRGGLLSAREALQVGMIDKIKDASVAGKYPKGGDTKIANGGGQMTLNDLKSAHPELYAEIMAEGERKGTANERARVDELLGWAESAPETRDIVIKAIHDGKTASQVMPQLISAMNAARNDNPPEVHTASTNTVSGEREDEEDDDNNLSAKILQRMKALIRG